MAKLQVIDWDTTAANNQDVGSIAILGTSPVSNFDNALREMMAEQAAAVTRHVTKAAGSYTALKTDHNQLWRATGAVTLNLTAAATLTTGWALWVKADGGAVTVDPSGAETINGAATLSIPDGSGAFIVCTGTAFFAIAVGTGNVAGPASATDNALARFDATTGKIIQNSNATLSDAGALALATTAAGQLLGLTSTDASATSLDVGAFKDSATPAVNDDLVRIIGYGNDSGGNQTAYALVRFTILDPTNGSEDGTFDILTTVAGALTLTARFNGSSNAITGNTTITGTLTVTG